MINFHNFCKQLVPSTLISSSTSHAFSRRIFVNKIFVVEIIHKNHKTLDHGIRGHTIRLISSWNTSLNTLYCGGEPEHTDFTTTLPHSPSNTEVVRAEGSHLDLECVKIQ